jgi:hypothetical protein
MNVSQLVRLSSLLKKAGGLTRDNIFPELAESAENRRIEIVRIVEIDKISDNRPQAFSYQDKVAESARKRGRPCSGQFYQFVNSYSLRWALNDSDGVRMIEESVA